MGLLIDSCVFVRFERTQRAIPFTDFGTRDKTFVSAVTVSEMLVGMHMANTPERFARRKLVVESLVSHLGVLNFTVSTAYIHAGIVTKLRKIGSTIGANDAYIAATALEHGHSVLTLNFGEFERVPGLTVIRWGG